MKKNDKTFRRYYLPFLSGAMDISLIGFSRLTVIFSLIHILSSNSIHSEYCKLIFQVFTIVNVCSVILSFMKRIYYKFQVATFILMGINFLIFILDMDFIGFLMFVGENAHSWYALLYIIVMLVIIIVSSAYYVYCYKVKKERVLGYGGVAKKKENSSNYWIIFGVVLIAPFVLTGHIKNLFGIFMGVLLSVVFPGTMVDSFYAAYLIHKYPEYKEKRE